MYPHNVFLHRGPSRFFWFLIGAGAATWWHHSAAMRDHRAQYWPCIMQSRRMQDVPTDAPPQDAAGRSVPAWGPDRSPIGWSHQRNWEQDRERLKNLQKRAGETVADLSESTLESLITGAESLKVKLAELRAERERLEAEKKAAQPAA